MRTYEEIVNRIREVADKDWLGFQRQGLINRLPFYRAKEFLIDEEEKEEVTLEDWPSPLPRTREAILEEMLTYMPFAWDKANNFRGLSAGRSMDHYQTWIWLLGDDIGVDLLNYEYYGKDHLKAICDFYGWDSSQWDDGVRLNHEP